MELYFNDFDADFEATEPAAGHPDPLVQDGEIAAEDIAFAELTERVSAARLVY